MADTVTLKTNWQARPVLYWFDLTDTEKAEFDYLESEDSQDEATFCRYKNWVYHLSEFQRITPAIAPHCQRPQWEKFDGYSSDSYFSGILVKYVDNGESVVCATYFS